MSIIDAIKDSMQGNSKKTIFAFGAVVIVIVALVAITYFFYNTNASSENLDFTAQTEIPNTNETSENIADSEPSLSAIAQNIDSQEAQNPPAQESQEAQNPPAQDSQDSQNLPNIDSSSTITQLKYIIKPLDKNIASCNTMRNGRWSMPNACKDEVLSAIKTLISTNSEIIAIEVSGVVDSSPYSGPSAELKQEGLASFRAREAIGVITRGFSNIAVFEGLSIQAPNKRGFEVKAYYLQN